MNLKNKIIEKGIISKKDWKNASPEHIKFASTILKLGDFVKKKNYTQFEEISKFDKHQFIKETREINDLLELQNVDKVENNKTFESQSIEMSIPEELIPWFYEIYSEIKKGMS